jgi:hypothetical protein
MWRGEPLGFFSLGLALGGERRTSLKDLAGGEPAAMNLTGLGAGGGIRGARCGRTGKCVASSGCMHAGCERSCAWSMRF